MYLIRFDGLRSHVISIVIAILLISAVQWKVTFHLSCLTKTIKKVTFKHFKQIFNVI